MSLTDIVDKVFYEVHRFPAAVMHSIANVTKYGTAKIETAIGIGALGMYIAATGMMLDLPQNKNPDLFNTSVTVGSALLLTVLYGKEFYKNYRETKVAQSREKRLEEQLLGNVVRYEEKLQRERQKGAAIWYALSFPIMGGFFELYRYLGGFQWSDPKLLALVGSAIVSTGCLYGARYVLTTDYNNKKPKKKIKANHGEEKNGK
jgi:hypothetical protein